MDGFDISGNEYAKDKLSSMISKDRMIPSILICGEKGLGKKTMAKYIAAALNCESRSGIPCGKCRSCLMAMHSNHPDIIFVTPSSKSGLYRVKEDIRPITSDAYISPNESGKKVYIIADAEKLNEEGQNALLKIFEEPPGETVFILTAENKQSVLETVLSRVFCFEMSAVSEEEAKHYLTKNGFSDQDAQKAQSAFPGNIGRQIEYLKGGDVFDSVVIARTIVDAVCKKNEYELLKTLSELDSRNQADNVLDIILQILGSALEYSTGANASMCSYNEGAKALAAKLTCEMIVKIHDTITFTKAKIQGYANLAITAASLTAEIAEIWF